MLFVGLRILNNHLLGVTVLQCLCSLNFKVILGESGAYRCLCVSEGERECVCVSKGIYASLMHICVCKCLVLCAGVG